MPKTYVPATTVQRRADVDLFESISVWVRLLPLWLSSMIPLHLALLKLHHHCLCRLNTHEQN